MKIEKYVALKIAIGVILMVFVIRCAEGNDQDGTINDQTDLPVKRYIKKRRGRPVYLEFEEGSDNTKLNADSVNLRMHKDFL